jgi:hypothetical protein
VRAHRSSELTYRRPTSCSSIQPLAFVHLPSFTVTIASVRMNQPTIVFEPPAWLAACERCQEAYAQARRTIEQAGGVEAWVERTTTPT